MVRLWWLRLFSSLLCAAMAASSAGPKFDGRGWRTGNHQENAARVLTEYVLPGETVHHWTELVTSEVFKDPRHAVSIAAFVDRIHASGARGCPSFVWHVIRQDEGTAIFEHHDAGCGGFEPESSLVRLATGDVGVYRLAYAARINGPIPPAKRREWLAILSQVPLAEASASALPPSRGQMTDILGRYFLRVSRNLLAPAGLVPL
jgi:hypothetical protein